MVVRVVSVALATMVAVVVVVVVEATLATIIGKDKTGTENKARIKSSLEIKAIKEIKVREAVTTVDGLEIIYNSKSISLVCVTL